MFGPLVAYFTADGYVHLFEATPVNSHDDPGSHRAKMSFHFLIGLENG